MALQYGSSYTDKSGYTTQPINSSTIMVENGKYRAEFTGSGAGTGLYQYANRAEWEQMIVNQILNEISIQYPNAMINYIEITNSNKVYVEWTWYPSSVSTTLPPSTHAQPAYAQPMIAPAVAATIIAVCIAATVITLAIFGYFSLEKTSVILDEHGDKIFPTANNAIIVIGILAVAALISQTNKRKQIGLEEMRFSAQYNQLPPPSS